MRIYLDTSALIALGDLRDMNHNPAVEYFTKSLDSGMIFVLGRHILIEYIDGLTKRVSKEKAIKALENISKSSLLFVENITEADWEMALKHFRRYTDKIDLTDSLSFALMERENIKKVFTFDKDFATHGFLMVP